MEGAPTRDCGSWPFSSFVVKSMQSNWSAGGGRRVPGLHRAPGCVGRRAAHMHFRCIVRPSTLHREVLACCEC